MATEPTRDWALRTSLVVLLLAVLIGAALRLPGLDVVPPGFHSDEAWYALDAINVSRGYPEIYFEANNGRQPLFIYSQALIFLLLGPSIASARLAAALWGIAFIPAMFWLTREILHHRPWRNAGASTAALLAAVLFWDLVLSRIGYRAGSLLPVLAVTLACLLAARRTGDWRWWLGGGVATGVGLYTYLTAWLIPVAVLVWLAVLLLVDRTPRRLLPGGAVWLGATAWLALPTLVYFWPAPFRIWERAGQVAATSAEGLLANAWRYAGMFIVSGDTIPRHNIPGAPAIDPLTLTLTLAGVAALATARVSRPALVLLLLAGGSVLAAGIGSDEAPHQLRVAGVLVPLLALAGVGSAAIACWLPRIGGRATWSVVAAVVLLGAISAWQYFGVYGTDPRVADAFDSDDVRLAHAITRQGAPTLVITRNDDQRAVLRFLTPEGVAIPVAIGDAVRLQAGQPVRFAVDSRASRAVEGLATVPGVTLEPIPGAGGAIVVIPGDLSLPASAAAVGQLRLYATGVQAGREPVLSAGLLIRSPSPIRLNPVIRVADAEGREVASSGAAPVPLEPGLSFVLQAIPFSLDRPAGQYSVSMELRADGRPIGDPVNLGSVVLPHHRP